MESFRRLARGTRGRLAVLAAGIGLGLGLGTAFGRAAWAAPRELSVAIKGAVCATCAKEMIQKLEKIPAVDHVEWVSSKRRLSVTLKEGRTLSDDLVAGIVRDAGYPVEKIDRAIASKRPVHSKAR